MSFVIEHHLHAEPLVFETHNEGDQTYFTVSIRRSFYVWYPGVLVRQVSATARFTQRDPVRPPPEPQPNDTTIDGPGRAPPRHSLPRPLAKGFLVSRETIPIELVIVDPDGVPFTRDAITPDDLRKYRDARGKPRPWTFTLTGRSRDYRSIDGRALSQWADDPTGDVSLRVAETVLVTSPGPILNMEPIVAGAQRFTFHLNRVGRFVAERIPRVPAKLRLIDPDGKVVGASAVALLDCPIELATLGPGGPGRAWTLEVEAPDRLASTGAKLLVNVIGEGRMPVDVIESRIKKLLGVDGNYLQFAGKNEGGKAKLVMKATTAVTAETLDMHGVFDSLLHSQGKPSDIAVDQEITLFSTDEDLELGLRYDVSSFRITNLEIALAACEHIDNKPPGLCITALASGALELVWGVVPVASASVRGGKATLELGLGVDADGTPRLHYYAPDPVDVEINQGVLVGLLIALGIVSGPLAVILATEAYLAALAYIRSVLHDKIVSGLQGLFDDPTLAARILMMLYGGHFKHYPPSIDDGVFRFPHDAPEEPTADHNFRYTGAIGRAVTRDAQGRAVFDPTSLGDTWAADNLKSKIKHIVVVMMENRSYDHVLGYRAQAAYHDGKDGLTPPIVETVNAAAASLAPPGEAHGIHPLRLSGFALTRDVNRRTRIPCGVGHELDDVTEQLAEKIPGPDGRQLNGPSGFVMNFSNKLFMKKHVLFEEEDVAGTVASDVLGYYEASPTEIDPNTGRLVDDLPMYTFLANHYAYSDRYFSSHAGPTFPNRMYSLTGDVQPDRFGQPILDSNNADNFDLSRATTIFDVLDRRGVTCRVYESFPSVTMLRMFSRYALDDRIIRPIEELEADLAPGVSVANVPSLIVIEPAMHHHPEDDDHPDADMWRGQRFIRRVYQALRQNAEVWAHTLLVITYDEHGGLYDHVVPPIADVFQPFERPPDGRPHPPVATAEDGATGAAPLEFGFMAVGANARAGAAVAAATETADPTVTVPYGVRVPTFLVSPWIPADARPPIVLDHCSILKTILARFCGDEKPFLGDRVHASHSFESFVTATEPRIVAAAPPDILELSIDERRRGHRTDDIFADTRTRTRDVSRKRMRDEQIDYHELSGRLARMLGR